MVVFADMFRRSNGKAVEYNGQTIQMMDEITIASDARLRVSFIAVNSEWRQGVSLTTEGLFEVAGQKIKRGLALWQDTSPREVEIVVTSKSGKVQIKNIWDTGNGVVESWHNGAAMIVDSVGEVRHYRCNDGHPDDDFDDLVFTLTTVLCLSDE